MTIVGIRKISYAISGFLVLASVAALLLWGLHFGIDFTGGSLLEVEFADNRPSVEEMQGVVAELNVGDVVVQPTGERGAIIRMRTIGEDEHQKVLTALGSLHTTVVEKRFVSIGPTIGQELKRDSIYALLLVIIMIVAYIAFAFRHVSEVQGGGGVGALQSWKYGVVAIVALIHDVIIPTGLFAYLGHFYGIEISALFISALLTILGFSVHDTIVVFDRIRENLRKRAGKTFEETIEISIRETITRSINTSLTLLLVLLTLFFFGGESTKYFSLALIVGTIVGVYSSIFVASPLLVSWRSWSTRRASR